MSAVQWIRPSRGGRIASALILALAVVVCAWFALGIRAFRNENGVIALTSSMARINRHEAKNAEGRLRDAAVLNPDINVDSLLARVYLLSGRRGAAIVLARDLTRREPMNVNSWLLLSALVVSDRAAYRRSQAHVQSLVPAVPQ